MTFVNALFKICEERFDGDWEAFEAWLNEDAGIEGDIRDYL